MIRSASARSSGVKSISMSSEMPCHSNGAGLVGNGWVAEVTSPGTVDCGTGRSSIGHQTRSPVAASTQTRLCAYRLSPGRWPPYQLCASLPTGS